MILNFKELAHHLKHECVLQRTCSDCNIEFATPHEFHQHLQYNCQYVGIQCNECDVYFNRYDFRMHDCYVIKDYKKQELLDSLEVAPVGAEKQIVE